MILDTSALAAIFFGEAEAIPFIQLIHRTHLNRISAATFVELFMMIESQLGADASRQCDAFLRRADVLIEPVTTEQSFIARQAFLDYGKGRHPAGLNFGDCFAFALARITGEPLLFKGADFAKTDIRAAVPDQDPAAG
ncbi:MAG TPA: type II toxin-antitoxin system VapC family toxin [Acidobacteriaceae bacterium]|jgi:ribonuclease VapC|nr:type II toxin-antitoxin system VapC family toxin [Acidobacteriaceae bacterium]